MSRAAVFALAGAGVGIAVAGLAFGPAGERSAEVAQSQALVPALPRERAPRPLRASSPAEEETASTVTVAPEERLEVDLAPDAVPPRIVRVLAEGTNEPVAGAEVHWMEHVANAGALCLRVLESPELELPDARSSVTDGKGFAPIPCDPSGRTLVWCAHADEWGSIVLDPGQERGRLHLEEDPPLRLRVVDDSGAPLEGVRIATSVPEGLEEYRTGTRVTDAEGRVRFEHLRSLLFARGRRAVRSRLLGALEDESSFDRRNWPQGEVVITVPPSGFVRLCVIGTDGRPRDVELAVEVEGEKKRPGRSIEGPPRFETEDGCLELLAPLGRTVRVGIAGQQPWSVPGPIRAGETVAETIFLEEPRTLAGRLVDPDSDRPQSAYAFVVFDPTAPSWGVEGRYVHLDLGADGSFRFDLQMMPLPRSGEASVRFSLDGGGVAEARLDLPFAPGVRDLGTLIAERERLLELTVTDERGTPVPGASVQVRPERRIEWDLTSVPRTLSVPRPFSFSVERLAGGRYVVWGSCEDEELVVTVSTSESVRVEQQVAKGARDLVVALPVAGSIEGRVLRDYGIDASVLQVRLSGPSPEQQDGLAGRGTFRFRDVPLRPHRLEVRLAGESRPLLVRGDVVPVASEEPEDPLELDVRGLLHEISVEVRRPDGRSADLAGQVRRVDAAGDGKFASFQGTIELVASTTVVDLELRIGGVTRTFREIKDRGTVTWP